MNFDVLSYVNFTTPKYNLRNSDAMLLKGLFKTNVFFNRTVDLCNCLPLDIRIIEHFASFKNNVNNFYLDTFNVNKDRNYN